MAYRNNGIHGLPPKKPGPKYSKYAIPKRQEQRILALKQKHPSWGARRIKYQYDLPCHWTTVHRAIKRHGLLVRIKPKPQPAKRFQRRRVDSMWHGDTFHFLISGVGKVYVTGFTDDHSRYRIKSKAYLHKRAKEAINTLCHTLKGGRDPFTGKQEVEEWFVTQIPYEIIVISGKGYVSTDAIDLLSRHNVNVVLLDSYGNPMSNMWRVMASGTATKYRMGQYDTFRDHVKVLVLQKQLLRAKLQSQIGFLQSLEKPELVRCV